MRCCSRAVRHLVFVALLSSVAAPMPVLGATPPQTSGRAVTPRPAGGSAEVIPLPLNPIIPAAQRTCAARTPSGLGYSILRPASGAKPAATDAVLVNYIGYLATTGAVFDQGMGSALQVDGVIPGFAEGVRMLSKTGIARFCIPAAMGYGPREAGSIPANSDLVFQVELVDHKTAAEVESLRRAQEAAQPPR